MSDLINLLSMPKVKVYAYCFPKYKKLKEKGHYRELLVNENKRLISLKKRYPNNMDFYNAVALEFTNRYIDIMIDEYNDQMNEEKVNVLKKIKTEKGIKILRPGDAVELGLIEKNKNGKAIGSEGAFARRDLGIICFTPEFEDHEIDTSDFSKEQKDDLAINNALRMMGAMIHETFHLLIDVRDKDEMFEWNENGVDKHTRGPAGFILNEAIVEKHAIDFSLKHKFPQNPALYYLHYVDFYNKVVSRNNPHNVFEDNYKKILSNSLTKEEFNLYRYNERVKFLEAYRYISNVKINMEDIVEKGIVK